MKPASKQTTPMVRSYSPRPARLALLRESVFLALAGLVAGLSIVIANDQQTAFGLIRPVALAQQIPTVSNFRTDVLVSEPFLDLDLYPQPKSETQFEGLLFNPKVPPPVRDLAAYNTRIGNEVGLFWTLPEGVAMVNIYRQVAGAAAGTEVQVAHRHEGQHFIDYEIEDKVRYQYRVAAVSLVDDTEYEAAQPVTALVTAIDEVPPGLPTDVVIAPVIAAQETGLLLTWTNPPDEDLARIHLYRSTEFGSRGQEIAVIAIGQPMEYLDTTAAANAPYFYTIVAEDTTGNRSSDDFQLPPAGKDQPFEPFSVEELLAEPDEDAGE
jgi:hypothetical protein